MAVRRSSSSFSPERTRGGFGPFLLGILFTLVTLGAGAWLYLHYGHPPVAVAAPAFPMEAAIVHIPLNARVDRELEKPPFGASEDAYERGAKIYVSSCASCHGTPGHDSAQGKNEYPHAPQLWKRHGSSAVVGVSDDEPGESYWKIKNGIRLTGMPAYEHMLSTDEMWDVTLLIKNADQPLPVPVERLLHAPVETADASHTSR